MRLLIITQKVDRNDPILGFFHRWVEEFAKRCELVTVICLEKGRYSFPKNIKVLSLGKEEKSSRESVQHSVLNKLGYIFRFYKYIWKERANYDSVFVHMNQEYVLLGWKFWRLWGKKIFLWRNHAKGSILTRIAVLFSDKVFCTSPASYTARFKKTRIMPVGIDTDFFKPGSLIKKQPNSILLLGRIAPVKNVEIFVEALKELRDKGVKFSATIAGAATSKDAEYEKMIRDKVVASNLGDEVRFVGAVNQTEALKLYRKHEIYVNLTLSGSMDKTIFEALASGNLVLVSNQSCSEILPDQLMFKEKNSIDLAKKLKMLVSIRAEEKKSLVDEISKYADEHDLKNTVGAVLQEMK